jgi:uracil-DNA glycosylase family 4
MNEENEQQIISEEIRILWENVIRTHTSSWKPIESNTTTEIKESEIKKLYNQINEFKTLRIFSNPYSIYWGMGNLNAKLVFLFYCPTAYEYDHRSYKSSTHQDLEHFLSINEFDINDIYFMYIFPWTIPNKTETPKEINDFFLPYVHRRLEIIRPKLVIGIGGKMKSLIDSYLNSKYYETDHKYVTISKTQVRNVITKTISFNILYIDHPYRVKMSEDSLLLKKTKELFFLADKICYPNKILGTFFLKNGLKMLDPTKEMIKSSQILISKKKESPLSKAYKKSEHKFKKSKIEEIQ